MNFHFTLTHKKTGNIITRRQFNRHGAAAAKAEITLHYGADYHIAERGATGEVFGRNGKQVRVFIPNN